jgi:hypothetical protein
MAASVVGFYIGPELKMSLQPCVTGAKPAPMAAGRAAMRPGAPVHVQSGSTSWNLA